MVSPLMRQIIKKRVTKNDLNPESFFVQLSGFRAKELSIFFLLALVIATRT